MTKAFEEYYRVLKPNRWITVEFSNTEAAVWNALQNSIGKAGFVVADVRDLHKQQGSTLGYTTTTATRRGPRYLGLQARRSVGGSIPPETWR